MKIREKYNYLGEQIFWQIKSEISPSCDGPEWGRQVREIRTVPIYFPYNFPPCVPAELGIWEIWGQTLLWRWQAAAASPFPPFCPNSTSIQACGENFPHIALKIVIIFQFLPSKEFWGVREIVTIFPTECWRRKLCWIKAVAAVNLSIGLSLN